MDSSEQRIAMTHGSISHILRAAGFIDTDILDSPVTLALNGWGIHLNIGSHMMVFMGRLIATYLFNFTFFRDGYYGAIG